MQRFPTAADFLRRAKTFWAHSATNKIVAVCTLIFVAQILGLFCANFLMLNTQLIREGYYLNFLTHGFLHGGIWHLALNMLTLYFVGNAVERYDSGKTTTTIFLGGIIAGGLAWGGITASLAVVPALHTLVGASAGIAALLAYFSISNRDAELRAAFFFVIPVQMRAWLLFTILAGVSLVFLFVSEIPSLREIGSPTLGVAHSAHLGGLVFGAAFALISEKIRSHYGNMRYFRR